jgi:hypothetical protein
MEQTMTDRSTIHAILVGARNQIADPAKWCQHNHFHILQDNGVVEAVNMSSMWFDDFKKVQRCCADGAVIMQTKGDQSDLYQQTVAVLAKASENLFGEPDFPSINDRWDGHEKVLQVFDLSIERMTQ